MMDTQTESLLLRRLRACLSGERGEAELPAELVRWLEEHAEPLESLLNEAQSEADVPVPPQPDRAALRLRQGLAHAQRGDYERALVEFTAALHADPTSAAAHIHRGDAYRLMGDGERALADYTAALRLDPTHVVA